VFPHQALDELLHLVNSRNEIQESSFCELFVFELLLRFVSLVWIFCAMVHILFLDWLTEFALNVVGNLQIFSSVGG